MNAIYGILRCAGEPISGWEMIQFGEDIRRRQGGGIHPWDVGPDGFGPARFQTAPQSASEALLLQDRFAGLAITADARLDNRDELLAQLDVSAPPNAPITDPAIILAAYRKWGERCAEKLLGDFAFAIWDAKARRLFCARDHFGVRPFFYSADSEQFVFASQLRAVLEAPEVSDESDESWIASFLTGMEDSASATAYRSIRRLPAGHFLTVDARGVQVRRYFVLEEPKIDHGRSPGETVEAFAGIFASAVRARFEPAGKVGCMLSGGLDSSSICCVARSLARGGAAIRTFSSTYPPGSGCDESEYVSAVLRLGGFDPHPLPATTSAALPALSSVLAEQGEPVFGPGLFANGKIYPAARMQGCTALLDGHGGDEVLSLGHRFLFELAEGDRWFRFALELAPLVVSRGRAALSAGGRLIANCGSVGRFRRRLALGRRLGRPPYSPPVRPRWSEHLAPDFYRAARLAERRGEWRAIQPASAATERSAHFRTLANPLQQRALEILHCAAASEGVEGRFPFWDKRVVEFCLSVPSEQKLVRGWNRAVLRQAMKGTLPEAIRLRRGKTDFCDNVRRSLALDGADAWEERVLRPASGVTAFIDPAWVRERLRALIDGRDVEPNALFALSRVAALGLWLSERTTSQERRRPAIHSILKP